MSNRNFVVKFLVEMKDGMTSRFKTLAERIKAASREMQKSIEAAGVAMRNFGKGTNDIGKNMTMKFTTAVSGFGWASLRAAGQVEKLTLKFESLLGSEEKAAALTKTLAEFAATTPFEMNDTSQAAALLLNAGVAVEELTDRLNVLGDVASLADMPLADAAKIFSRIKSSGTAYTMELEMLSDRSVAIWQALEKTTGKSMKRLKKEVAAGKVSFDLFNEALQSLREEGGPAYQQMGKQGESFFGLISTLGDEASVSLAGVGRAIIDNHDVKGMIKEVTEEIEDLGKAFLSLPIPTQKYAVYGAVILALVGPLLMLIGQFSMGLGVALIGLAKFGSGVALLSGLLFKTLIPALWAAGVAAFELGIAFMATPLGWITAGIAALAVAGYLIVRNWEGIKTFWAALWAGIVENVRAAYAYIEPLIKAIGGAMRLMPAGAVVRAAGMAASAMNAPAQSGAAALQKVDAGGEIRIVIDENRRAKATARMNNPGLHTTVDQGVIMGGAL